MTYTSDEKHFELTVNGSKHQVKDSFLGASLLSVLRDHIGMTGSKGACEEGECGSCSVLLDGNLVCSCLVLAASVTQSSIVTIEGLGGATDVQQAFVECGAIQCGFCSPGLVMAATNLLDRNPDPDVDDVREALAGNLCRCTGYGRILDAVQVAVDGRKRNKL
ncbi:MAG: (2Fe-2S)-binding protein [Actinobacteria bacterium]|jgi:carbon-monoxide dehydrogenase small subunit|nr:(2Fe-2S)-binding protein [Ilumatobacteraceae bacterium]MDA0299177.1 (2Fe-2S)-binding protein [Actinomycetota bacterium]MDA2961196.1 (2Fe-2S)-binding protein [Actinomycetota bacterium]MDA2994109.1 (2Fe-2S)-binding protein [Actinomycetota bacterium]